MYGTMANSSVRSSDPVVLIGAGDLKKTDLEEALSLGATLVAADGGADKALKMNEIPDLVIGDLDSLSPAARDRIPPEKIVQIAEQDSTDFDKALRSVFAPVVLAVGFLGSRVDHQLAVFNALVQANRSPCILIGAQEVIFHAPRAVDLALADGDVVSLFPMRSVSGRSTGLQWPIDGLELSPEGRVGTSNRALGPVRIETDGPGMLVILPRRALDVAIAAVRPDP